MKRKYLIYIIIFLVILLRGNIINIINNTWKILFIKDNNIEIEVLTKENETLKEEYNSLLTFTNNIKLESNYIITNVIKNNYGFDELLVNGTNYNTQDEVVNEKGLVGLINKKFDRFSTIQYIYDTNIAVKINNNDGKIINKDKDNNIIVGEISNYNDISINDKVYSVYDTYIGKVISKIKKDYYDEIIVKPAIDKDINYVAVITR